MPAAQEVRHKSERPSTTDPAPVPYMPAAYAAADVVVSAADQPEGVQRALLEVQNHGASADRIRFRRGD
jgi:hypothetical protein